MPGIETAKAGLLWESTSVANAFITEYMPSAPDGHVKVYLYCLMLAHSGVDHGDDPVDLCAAGLGMPREQVTAALRYWERCRLVERVSDNPPRYRFTAVLQSLLSKEQLPQDDAYESFAQALYAAFGEKRKLHGGDTVLAYEWVEQLKLPPEVVLMLVQHMISTHGVHFSFTAAQKMAVQLAENKVFTIEEAEAFFSRSEAVFKGTKAVLRKLGMKRDPSDPEMDLYRVWTADWGFEPKAILEACSETVKGSPTFAYLNKILEGIHKRAGSADLTEKQVRRTLDEEREEKEHVRELLGTLGISSANLDEGQRAAYRGLAEMGGHEMVMLAAKEVLLHSKYHTLDKVAEVLSGWQEHGLSDVTAVQARLSEIEALNARLKALLKLIGRESGVNRENRTLLEKWTKEWKLSDELIDASASLASGKDKPFAYMDTLLQGWHGKNIPNAEEALAEHERFLAEQKRKSAVSLPAPGVKKVNEQNYTQREYKDEDFAGLSAAQLEELNRT